MQASEIRIVWKKWKHVLEELHISYEGSGCVLTHKHHDHSGLTSIYARPGQRSIESRGRTVIIMTACSTVLRETDPKEQDKVLTA